MQLHLLLDVLPKCKGVYAIYNYAEKKYYIGFASGRFGIRGRIYEHIFKLNRGIDVPKLQESWNEDKDSWVVAIVELTEDKNRELLYIEKFNSVDNGYNVLLGHKHTEYSLNKMRNRKFTDAHKQHLSESHKGQVAWNKGINIGSHSDESNKKRSESVKKTLAYQKEHKLGRYS